MSRLYPSGPPGVRKGSSSDPVPGNDRICPRCGSSDLVESRLKDGPHFNRITCRGCEFSWYGPKPWSLERARAFRAPFGKYRGRTVAELAEIDRGYLEWAAAKMQNNFGMAAQIALAGEGGGL